MAERIGKGKYFAYVRRQVSRRSRPRASPRSARRASASSRRASATTRTRSWRRTCLATSASTTSAWAASRRPTTRSSAAAPGTVLVQTDAQRTTFSRVEQPPTAGASLELTIDEYLQHIAERELRAGVQSSGAAGGSVDRHGPVHRRDAGAGERSDFNPNAYRDVADELRRNRAIQDLYEPGSTFKIVTASAAFEEQRATPADLIDASAGNIRFGSRVIDEADHNYGMLTFEDVIVKSSNVGAIKVGAEARARDDRRLRHALRLRPPDLAGLPRRERGDRLGSRRSSTTARWRRCRWAIRSASRRCRWPRRSAPSPTAAS